jgi:hypothetical protein
VEFILTPEVRAQGFHDFVIESSCNGMFGVPWFVRFDSIEIAAVLNTLRIQEWRYHRPSRCSLFWLSHSIPWLILPLILQMNKYFQLASADLVVPNQEGTYVPSCPPIRFSCYTCDAQHGASSGTSPRYANSLTRCRGTPLCRIRPS